MLTSFPVFDRKISKFNSGGGNGLGTRLAELFSARHAHIWSVYLMAALGKLVPVASLVLSCAFGVVISADGSVQKAPKLGERLNL